MTRVWRTTEELLSVVFHDIVLPKQKSISLAALEKSKCLDIQMENARYVNALNFSFIQCQEKDKNLAVQVSHKILLSLFDASSPAAISRVGLHAKRTVCVGFNRNPLLLFLSFIKSPRKPEMERKRRQRINKCLSQIKLLLPEAKELEVSMQTRGVVPLRRPVFVV